MTAVHSRQLVDGYIGRLELELLDLPPERRREIVDDIREHIADERTGLKDETDADLMNLLDRLGDPAEIAAAARDGRSRPPAASSVSRVGWIEILALILTPTLWPVGVILLWLSSAWTTRQKLIGTLLPPGGYPGVFVALVVLQSLMLQSVTVCSGTVDAQGRFVDSSCNPPQWEQFLVGGALIVGVLVLLVLPVVVGIFLATRLRSRPQV